MPSTERDTLAALGVVEAAGRIRAGTLTATALVEACLGRIEADDDRVRAWVHVDRDGARQAARDLDEAAGRGPRGPRADGQFLGPLHGIPVGVKDIIDVAEMPTTGGARPWAHRTPTADATAVARLRAAGAIILGKTATTQFAHRDPAPTRNPCNPAHTPGGSSSGSGAAVAARMVPLALGTQTVGSVLRPAAYCGVVGVKPTHGLVPVEGVIPLAWSLDHVGVLARSVADAALGLGVMAGRELSVRQLGDLAGRPAGARRLGVARELLARCEPATRECLEAAVTTLGRAGASLVDVPFPGDLDELLAAGGLVMQVEATAYHEADWRLYAAEYGQHLDQLVRDGLAIGGAAYVRANRVRLQFRASVLPLLEGVDALLAPTAPGPAPEGLAWTGDASLCAPWSFAGTPAVTLPAGLVPAREVAELTARLPVGLQLVAAPGREAELLTVAAWAEQALEPGRA